jgi:hypothetical protein|tara:strand:- start:1098 stop:1370 length:273 start_codon:yes stop_codon:yes gene_type:complete
MQPNNVGDALAEMNNLMTSSMNYATAKCLKDCALDIIQIMKDELAIEGKQDSDKSNRKMFVNISSKVTDLAKSYQEQAKEIEKRGEVFKN